MAKLTFKYSTMNSGKSMDLLRTVYNYEENGFKVLVMKPEIDTRGDDTIVTRAGLSRKVDILISKNAYILKLLRSKAEDLENVKCVFVDEAQFLSVSQVNELFTFTKALDIPVICYGLRNNFRLRAFEGSARLLEIADVLEEFKTLCYCGEIARYCGRKVNGEYVSEGDDVVIDGSDNVEYVPLCGEHYLSDVSHLDFNRVRKLVKKK